MNQGSKTPDKAPGDTALPKPIKSRFVPWVPVILLLATLLFGFVPMWLKSSRLEWELRQAQLDLRRTQIQLTLAYAALEARRGDYETARRGAAHFFGLVTADLNRGIDSAFSPNARFQLQPLLAERDDLITLLARSDAASAERLANASPGLRKALGQQ